MPATVALAAVLAVVVAGIVGDLLIALRPTAEVAAAPEAEQDSAFAGVALLALLVLGVALPFMGFAAVVQRASVPVAVVRLLCALNAAAVVFMLAQALTYDVYGDSATRYTAYGRAGWVAVFGVLAAVMSLLVRRFPRSGLIADGLFLWTCSVAAFLAIVMLH